MIDRSSIGTKDVKCYNCGGIRRIIDDVVGTVEHFLCSRCSALYEIDDEGMKVRKQPRPTPNTNPAIADIVMKDIEFRKHVGLTKYKVHLQAHNGRDPLIDAYEESLDMAQYLRQAIFEKYGA